MMSDSELSAPAAAPPRACPACGEENAGEPTMTCSRDGWNVKRCPVCAFVYLANAPAYEALKEEFAWDKTYLEEKKKRREGRRLRYLFSDAIKKLKYALRGGYGKKKVHRYINRYVPDGNILDVGCSRGRTLWGLRRGLVPWGIEISPVLAALAEKTCAERGGHVVQDTALDGMAGFQDGFFAGIVMRAFLEHEIRPRELLRAARRVLVPGGCVVIKVPNYACVNRRVVGRRWCGFRMPDHVNYFTPATLRKMVQDTGYTVQRFGLLDRWPFSDNMWMVIQRPR